MSTQQLRKRLDNLAPSSEACKCANPTRIVYPAGYLLTGGIPVPDPGPEVCPVCGGQRLTVTVQYAEKWRENESDLATTA